MDKILYQNLKMDIDVSSRDALYNSIYKVTVNNNGELKTTKVTFDENGNGIITEEEIPFE